MALGVAECVAFALLVPLRVFVGVRVPDRVGAAERDCVRVSVDVRVTDFVADVVRVDVRVAVPLRLCERDGVVAGLGRHEFVAVADGVTWDAAPRNDGVPVGVPVGDAVGDVVADCDAGGVRAADGGTVAVLLLVGVREHDCVTVCVLVSVGECDDEADDDVDDECDDEADGECDGEGEIVCEPVLVAVRLPVRLFVALPEVELDGVNVGVMDHVGVVDGVRDCEAVAVLVCCGDDDEVGEPDGVDDADGVSD